MKLRRLKIRNFLGIAEADLSFDRKGLVLIGGVNHDSPVASSNGSGKSSIYEAIYYALYGKTKRGVSGDEVINQSAGRNCRVELEFDDYLVARARKDEEYGTALKLFQAKDGGWSDITKGTMKDTQDVLEKSVGMSDLTFNKVCYFGQGDLKPFASLSDAELKQVFEQALNLSFISDYHSAAKSEIETSKRQLDALRHDMERQIWEQKAEAEKADVLAATLADLDSRSELEKRRTWEEIEQEESTLIRLKENLREAQTTFDSLAERFAQVQEELAELKKSGVTMAVEKESVVAELARVEALEEMDRIRLARTLSEADGASSKEGQPCGECGRIFTEADLAQLRNGLRLKAERIEREMENRILERLAVQDRLVGIIEGEKGLHEKLRAKEEILAKINPDAQKVKTEGFRKLVELSSSRIARLGSALEALSLQASTEVYRRERERCLSRIEAAAVRLDTLQKEQKEIEDEMEAYSLIEEIFSNTGMKSYIFDSVTPELNRLINGYLSYLSPDINVEISTVTRLKGKRERFREKFAVNVWSLNGAASYEGSSDGEKQLINLAIALAFNSLCRTLIRRPVNFLWMDEPFESLDEYSAERAVEICKEFSSQVDNLFVISHNPAISDLVTDRIVVEKRNGAAALHLPLSLQQPGRRPAEQSPYETRHPTRQHIRRIMGAQIDSTDSHKKCQKQSRAKKVRLHQTLGLDPCQESRK